MNVTIYFTTDITTRDKYKDKYIFTIREARGDKYRDINTRNKRDTNDIDYIDKYDFNIIFTKGDNKRDNIDSFNANFNINIYDFNKEVKQVIYRIKYDFKYKK